jgi:hypothetical protein
MDSDGRWWVLRGRDLIRLRLSIKYAFCTYQDVMVRENPRKNPHQVRRPSDSNPARPCRKGYRLVLSNLYGWQDIKLIFVCLTVIAITSPCLN